MPQSIPSRTPDLPPYFRPCERPPTPREFLVDLAQAVAWDRHDNVVWRWESRKELHPLDAFPPEVIYQLETRGGGPRETPLVIAGFDTIPEVPAGYGVFWLQERVDGTRHWVREFSFCFSRHPRDQIHLRDFLQFRQRSRDQFHHAQQVELTDLREQAAAQASSYTSAVQSLDQHFLEEYPAVGLAARRPDSQDHTNPPNSPSGLIVDLDLLDLNDKDSTNAFVNENGAVNNEDPSSPHTQPNFVVPDLDYLDQPGLLDHDTDSDTVSRNGSGNGVVNGNGLTNGVINSPSSPHPIDLTHLSILDDLGIDDHDTANGEVNGNAHTNGASNGNNA